MEFAVEIAVALYVLGLLGTMFALAGALGSMHMDGGEIEASPKTVGFRMVLLSILWPGAVVLITLTYLFPGIMPWLDNWVNNGKIGPAEQ